MGKVSQIFSLKIEYSYTTYNYSKPYTQERVVFNISLQINKIYTYNMMIFTESFRNISLIEQFSVNCIILICLYYELMIHD